MLFAQFIDGPAGLLFVAGHRPGPAELPAHWVLVVPPLGEELNKSRRTLGLLGQSLAGVGLGLVVVDLFGTGDSEGDFRAATWQGWVADIACARRWLLDQGARRVDLLAVRGGALLAWDYLAQAQAEAERLLLWQPIIGGHQLATQLLRLRLAAGALGKGEAETAASLRDQLAREHWLDIAGYRFSAGLFAGLEAARLTPLQGRRIGAIDWFQVQPGTDQALAPAAQSTLDAWRGAGLAVGLFLADDEPFWATQEICAGTALVQATTERLAQLQGSGRAAP